jgi:hypothetical protein
VEKNVVTPASPSVVEADTKVGPATPPPPAIVRVTSPEMIVVNPLAMMVVTYTEVIVEPSMIVVACCSIVRVMVAEQAQDVWYTAHQLIEEA